MCSMYLPRTTNGLALREKGAMLPALPAVGKGISANGAISG